MIGGIGRPQNPAVDDGVRPSDENRGGRGGLPIRARRPELAEDALQRDQVNVQWALLIGIRLR